MNIQYMLCVNELYVGDCGTCWCRALRVRGNTGGTVIYYIGSALNKRQQDLWCIPTGVLRVVFMFACVSVNVCVVTMMHRRYEM